MTVSKRTGLRKKRTKRLDLSGGVVKKKVTKKKAVKKKTSKKKRSMVLRPRLGLSPVARRILEAEPLVTPQMLQEFIEEVEEEKNTCMFCDTELPVGQCYCGCYDNNRRGRPTGILGTWNTEEIPF